MNISFFSSSPPSDFLCYFCHNLIIDPQTCSDCLEINFCSKCAEIHLKQLSAQCPNCQTLWNDKSLRKNPIFTKIYNKIEIICSNEGCTWKGNLNLFELHQEQCITECPMKKFGCKWTGTAIKLKENHCSTCSFSPFKHFFEQFEKNQKQFWCKKIYVIMAFLILISWIYAFKIKSKIEHFEKEISNLNFQVNVQRNFNSDEITNQIIDLRSKLEAHILNINQVVTELKKDTQPIQNISSPLINGLLRDVSVSSLLSKGFKIGFIKPYNHRNSFEELEKFQSHRYVIIGGKRTGKDKLIIAAMGEGREVFKETFDVKQCHQNNGVCWYFMRDKSFGFSLSPKIYLESADWIEGKEKKKWEDDKLSWHVSKWGGFRLGNIVDLHDSVDYEKVILYLD